MSFLFLIFQLYFFLMITSCDSILSQYQSYRRAKFNPYSNFYSSMVCECQSGEMITPQLRIFARSQLFNLNSEFDIISLISPESFKNKNIYLRYNKNQCGLITFNSNDIIIVKGRVEFKSSDVFIEPTDGYIDHNGKKYCVE